MAIDVVRTPTFDRWLARLRDARAQAIVAQRITRLAEGQLGDVRSVGGNVGEVRVDHGPGYRLYFTRRGAMVIVLLCGGDKDSQVRDIARARAIAEEFGRET